MTRIIFRVTFDLVARIDKECAKSGVSRSEFIRRAIEAALKSKKSKGE